MVNSSGLKEELFPLCEEFGKLLDQVCLVTGISCDDFFRHFAEEIGNDGNSRHTQSYKRRVPQMYLINRFSFFVSAVDSAVKACGTDETISNRKEITETWSNCGESFMKKFSEINHKTREIVLSYRYK